MSELIRQIQIKVNELCFLKDPNTSELGKKIISTSIEMIDEMGFEQFTFRKLAHQLNSTESSVYRYFENKFKLLLYLTTWYWSYMEYLLLFSTSNINAAEERLKRTFQVLSGCDPLIDQTDPVNMKTLNRIVVSESLKTFLNKAVDEANKAGLYAVYKRIIKRIGENIREINPNFPNPLSLVSTVMEGLHLQQYFAEHLPSISDISNNPDELADFYYHLILNTIQKDI